MDTEGKKALKQFKDEHFAMLNDVIFIPLLVKLPHLNTEPQGRQCLWFERVALESPCQCDS